MTTTIRLADYRPYPFRIDQVDLTFRLSPTATRVRSRLHLAATSDPADLRLDGENLTLIRAAIDGKTVAVTPGTDYQLSGWFASLFGGAPSSVEFRIDGQLIQPNFTLTSNIGAWEEHAVTFNSGQRSQISIEIWDTSGVASGNDYAIDDISLAAVPAPGAMGLIGVGGLLASRRRRA